MGALVTRQQEFVHREVENTMKLMIRNRTPITEGNAIRCVAKKHKLEEEYVDHCVDVVDKYLKKRKTSQ